MAKLKIIKTYTLELDEEEISLIHALTGSVIGNGKYREISDKIWNDLNTGGLNGSISYQKYIKGGKLELKEVINV